MSATSFTKLTKHLHLRHIKRCYCSSTSKLTNSEVREKRNALFDEERKRQLSLITRIEKIRVEHIGPPENCTLIMNKGLSTPFNCAAHIAEYLTVRSAVALVNNQPWDMHRPLTEDCELKFVHYRENDPYHANKAYWKSCSFILGHILEVAFQDQYYTELCSFPPPYVPSGSFVYDVKIPIPNWQPSHEELQCMGQIGAKLAGKDWKFECLDIDETLALKMFEDNRFKTQQIPNMAAQNKGGKIRVYRMGDHLDISNGPLICRTSQIGRFAITAFHPISSPDFGELTRVQGLSVPSQVLINHWTFDFLAKRAEKYNEHASLPAMREPPPVKEEVQEEEKGYFWRL
ncbi:39S ribosomal protein L39, mitochondrial-like [Lingula anatina]|uniref:39S ribosomal protein L39, mitochondrial-like n=1 Tax=Lingula anatina TaxID=7574 RepID=A0A1S3JQ87_LINAN|nr:39S ribosomal protein L39, mitochondrial-like [Lingula anatina]|eukprot:XP_013412316.1 39S ribosomal protein L39, mitochondrial-like [Lingula anatina]